MALMTSLLKQASCKNHVVLWNVIRNSGHWLKDYKPGDYPKTPTERLDAAIKYNLLPEDYEPYPDDGAGLGDYPKLPMISADVKDKFYPWDFPELCRNFNEPLHAQVDMLGEDRYNVNARLRYPLWVLAAQFFGFMGISFGLQCAGDKVKAFRCTAEKQYSYSGESHYTFELKE